MRRASLILFAALIPAFAADLIAAEQWTRITTPDFELYTTAGEKKGKETIRRFEQVREFFLKASPVRASADFPVRIIEFQTPEQYQPFIPPNSPAAAYFHPTALRDYIVLGNEAVEHPELALHEYMHEIVRHSGLRIPVWLNEGWADVYSTIRPEGKGTAVGDLIDERMRALTRDRWLSFDELTSTDMNSPNYHEGSRVGIFYAESWALTHMLYLAPDYKDNFGKFVMALHRGSTTAEACRIAFNREPEVVFQDLKAYMDRKKIYGRVFQAGMEGKEAEPVAASLTAFDSRLMLADLLFTIRKLPEAKRELALLEKEQPDRAEPARLIGYVALLENDPARARLYLEKAYNAGDADPQMCFQLAKLKTIARGPPAEIIPVLERALKSNPDFTEAKIRLGTIMAEARDFPAAIATLMAIPQVTPDRASEVYCGLTYARVETGDLAMARQNADACGKWAKTDIQKDLAQRLQKLATARSQPAAAVRPGEKWRSIAGTARSFDCSPQGNRLQLLAGNKAIVFDLPPIDAVEISSAPQGFHLACGALTPVLLEIDYAPPRSVMETSAGIVRRILFANTAKKPN